MPARKITKLLVNSIISFCSLFNFACYNFSKFQSVKVLEDRIARGRALIVTIEGLQPYSGESCAELGEKLAKEFELGHSASSGNWKKHLPIIKKAYENGCPIYLFGYSAGTEEVWRISRACKKLGIPIKFMIYLDPTHKNNLFSGPLTKIPSNVEFVFSYIGDSSGLLGGRALEDSDFESERTKYVNSLVHSRHLDLPYSSFVHEDLRKRVKDLEKIEIARK